MSWRKNGFSYIAWLVYTLLTGTALLALTCGKTKGTAEGILGAAVILLAAGATAFLLYRFTPRRSGEKSGKRTVWRVAEAAVAAVLLAIGLWLRLKGLEGAGEAAAYFEMAEVAPGQRIPQIAHGAVYFYVRLLHIVFYFLGNKFTAGIWLQLLLQFGAALLLYPAVRRLTGPRAALAALAFLMCSPYMIQKALVLSPEMLYLFFWAAVFAWVSAYTVRLRTPDFLFLGMAVSAVSYLDISGLLLFLFAVAVIFCVREEAPGGRKKAGALSLCFLGFLIGFAVCVCADAWCSGKSVCGVLLAWFTLYQPEGFLLSVETAAAGSVWEGLLPVALMTVGVFSFWCDQKRDRMGAYVLGLCLVLAASLCGVFTPEMPGNLFVFLLAVLLAGTGVEQCFRTPAEQAAVGSGRGEAAEETLRSAELLETAAAGETGRGKGLPEAGEPENPSERKIKYIDNPLPLPKKHVRRVMDYRLKPEAESADFDVEIADDDDFDI